MLALDDTLLVKKLGWRKIPCQIVDLTDMEAFEISIVENVQRKTLNPIEETKEFKKYVYDNGWGSVSELATKLGKSPGYVTKRIMLLDLPGEVTNPTLILIHFISAPGLGQWLNWLQA